MRNILLISINLLIAATLSAIPTDSLFVKMPDKILPTLSQKQRFELAEYFKAGKADSVPNLFGRNTILQKYDTANCHIVLKTSLTGLTEIKRIIISENKTLIGIIQTVNQPFKISNIQFFTENWQPYRLVVNFPELNSWINEKKQTDSGVDSAWIKNLLRKSVFSMNFNDSNELEIENNVLNTLSTEDKKLIEPIFENKKISVKIQN